MKPSGYASRALDKSDGALVDFFGEGVSGCGSASSSGTADICHGDGLYVTWRSLSENNDRLTDAPARLLVCLLRSLLLDGQSNANASTSARKSSARLLDVLSKISWASCIGI